MKNHEINEKSLKLMKMGKDIDHENKELAN